MATTDIREHAAVVLLNIRPWSESSDMTAEAWFRYLRQECGSELAAAAIETAVRRFGAGPFDEWVTSTSARAGVDALLRPTESQSAQPQRAGGIVRVTVRFGVASSAKPGYELLKLNDQGQPSAAACVIPGITIVPEALRVDPKASHRAAPQGMHQLFSDPAAHKHVLECLDACREACLLAAEAPAAAAWPRTNKRARGAALGVWGVLGELLSMMASAHGSDPGATEIELSTHWDPLALRSSRPANANELVQRGCRCAENSYRFQKWVLHGCPLGVLRLRAGSLIETSKAFVALMRHDALFQLLSRARAHPVNRRSLYRGFIEPDEPEFFRVAAGLDQEAEFAEDDADSENDWYATYKHHLAFVLRTEDLRVVVRDQDHMTSAALWRKGALLLIASAPRSRAGRRRMKFAAKSPITGDCLVVILSWVGNYFFGHESLRRGTFTAPLHQLSGVTAAPEPGELSDGVNVLRGILSEDAIELYTAQSGVPLDNEQRHVLSDFNTCTNTVLCVSALAGAGKTALAHCVLKAFVEANRDSDSDSAPRSLVLYTVPTRALREEVVMELTNFKV